MYKYSIGIDLGGTNIKGGIVDNNGVIIYKGSVETESKKGEIAVMDKVVDLANNLIIKANIDKNEIKGIGIGIPGMIDSKNGVVIFAGNLKFRNLHIASYVQDKMNLKTVIANDANVAGLGEATFGVGKKYNDSILVTLGTGVGGGIIINNKIFEGNKGAGAEIGHMVIKMGGNKCTCGRNGCFEAYCSATALIKLTSVKMTENKNSKLWDYVGGDLTKVTGKTAFDVEDSDETAREVVQEYIEALSDGLANLANIFRPEVIMLGGGVCNQGDRLIVPLQKLVDGKIFAGGYGPDVKILIASLGNDAGLLGASAL